MSLEVREAVARVVKASGAKAPAKGESYPELQGQLDALYSVLGKATLIPVKIWGRPGENGDFSKGAPLYKGWLQTTYAQSTSPAYQRELCDRLRTTNNGLGLPGNIAVLLGAPSDNLIAIDFDRADLVEPFLEANPKLRSTLRIATFRGQQLFLRMTGKYPDRVHPILVDGESVGEFRGGQGLSTVLGFHPKSAAGNPVVYSFVCTSPVMPFAYDQIVWPAGWEVPVKETKRKAKQNYENRKQAQSKLRAGQFDLQALREAIACDVEGLCKELFPNGRMVGSEFRLADKTGREPKGVGSLAVQTRGDYAGTWIDWTTRESGDVIDLVQSVYHETFPLAVERIEAALGKPYRIENTPTDPVDHNTPPPPPRQKAHSPRPILYIPVDGLTENRECNEVFYKGCAATEEFFLRDEKFVYAEEDKNRGVILRELKPGELVSKIEDVFQLRKKSFDKTTGNLIERPVNLRLPEAVPILADGGKMRKHSLSLRLLSASPIIIDRGGYPEVLRKGYHPDEGGIYVMKDLDVPAMSLDDAKQLLLDLFLDYDFIHPSDLSRAIAHLLSPALKLGNLLGDADFPLDVALGNVSQSGKGHRMKLNQAVYGEVAWTITKTKGGVGGLDESIATALLSGKLFVTIDDVRGDLDSQLLESILRGTGRVSARVPYRISILTQTNRSIWSLTSNGVTVPKDLTNRSIIVSNRKQPPEYKLNPKSSLGWGDNVVFANLRLRQAEYLGAVFAVVGDWIRGGKDHTDEKRHDFTAWVQAMDYIVTKILGLAPLMDDHEIAQSVLNDPVMGWVRAVMTEVEKRNPALDVTLRASDIAELCDEGNIDIPNHKDPFRNSPLGQIEKHQHIGRLLGKLYRDQAKENPQNADVIRIERIGMKRIQTPNAHGGDDNSYKFYYF